MNKEEIKAQIKELDQKRKELCDQLMLNNADDDKERYEKYAEILGELGFTGGGVHGYFYKGITDKFSYWILADPANEEFAWGIDDMEEAETEHEMNGFDSFEECLEDFKQNCDNWVVGKFRGVFEVEMMYDKTERTDWTLDRAADSFTEAYDLVWEQVS